MAFAPSPSIANSAFTAAAAPALSPMRPCAPSRAHSQPARMVLGKTVKETLECDPSYKTLVALAAAAGVDLDVSNCTVFAPKNGAFARLRAGIVEQLLADPMAARDVVLRHILPGSVLSSGDIKGTGFFDGIPGGPLSYSAVGACITVGGMPVEPVAADNMCDNGMIHGIEGVILTDAPAYKPQTVTQYYTPSVPNMSIQDSTVTAVYSPAAPLPGNVQRRAVGAASSPSTVGGRKAMGLMKQLPFWCYGPPFNAAKQEDYEPISIAEPDGACVDYQLMPPGTVIVTPDEVSAAKLLPVSGMSKYIGKTQKIVGGDGKSNYSRLDN